jgi:hypothetical protein
MPEIGINRGCGGGRGGLADGTALLGRQELRLDLDNPEFERLAPGVRRLGLRIAAGRDGALQRRESRTIDFYAVGAILGISPLEGTAYRKARRDLSDPLPAP